MKNLNLIARFKRSKPEIGPLHLGRRRKIKKEETVFKKLGLEGRILLK
jgi:hypothetical protein